MFSRLRISNYPYQPYLKIASKLSSWFRIRAMLIFSLLCLIVQIILSIYTMKSTGGSYNVIDSHLLHSSSTDFWNKQICQESPFIYLVPFEFSFNVVNSTSNSNEMSYAMCPWPAFNSTFRMAISCVSFLLIVILFCKTFLSHIGRTQFLIFSTQFFTAFVLDINQMITGYSSCYYNFYGTKLGDSIQKYNLHISCITSGFAAVVVFDLLLCFQFYLLFECWGMCKNLYNEECQKPFNIARDSVLNVIHNKNSDEVNQQVLDDIEKYKPFEPEAVDYSPYDPKQYEPISPKGSKTATSRVEIKNKTAYSEKKRWTLC